MEKRNDEVLNNFNLDSEKIGWYLVCYTRNFWDSLETIKYYEVSHRLSLRIISIPASSLFLIIKIDWKGKILIGLSD